jgi:hypothetical protein
MAEVGWGYLFLLLHFQHLLFTFTSKLYSMKNVLFMFLFLSIPYFGFGQKKASVKNNAAPQSQSATSGSSCQDNALGLHLTLSGKDYDEEGVTDVNGRFTFTNVPAGDKVITKTGEDKSTPSCRFNLSIQSPLKGTTKSGTFKELTNGVSFQMSQAGNVTFSVK